MRPLPGLRRTADIVFRRQKVAVLIDGCYWHGCPEHYTAPASNSGFWRGKVERNRERDADTDERLREAGWVVMRFWTHHPAAEIASDVERAVRPGI